MAKEIERKFLVANDGWRSQTTSATPMRQAYLSVNHDRSIRVRTSNEETAKLTIKFGSSALVRDEFEYTIPLEEAAEMIEFAVGNVIEKVRYTVEVAGFTWEVDVFEGAYRGLVIAEVELKSEEDRPVIPDWVGREVTGDRRYSNQALATERLKPELVHAVSN
ncbi:CYTH domain-containing protein [Rhizobium sp. S95]|uniref:CYTH domain-containing protein n=1 Tax=Ciceribacter sichuanensis TaxID=2949647 RepID=A0AAJ1BZE9_9HYPH|nr:MULTISPECIES: CYTH domain-containing protein [unclassified Ciceribacter]MCM2398420.1 CYTH domain-containing protein [Ciceribacter sp. S95]MCO5958425.1 CYTH domain-containing protein [Ciceribacter sp. S101]